MKRSNLTPTGFTLIELLVVISIISLLISVLLPALSAAKKTSNATVCLSKMRQMGQALVIYAQDYDQSLPPGTYSGTDSTNWMVLSLHMLGVQGTTFAQQASLGSSMVKTFFTDTDAITPSATNMNPNHYSAHPRLMPDISTFESGGSPITGPRRSARIDAIRNPSDLILVYDGTQIASANVASVGIGLDADRIYYGTYLLHGVTGSPEDRIRAGENRDAASWADSNVGEIRFRHMNNTRGNLLFVDGHAGGVRYNGNNGTDIFRRNVNVNITY